MTLYLLFIIIGATTANILGAGGANGNRGEILDIKLYFESQCSGSRDFYTTEFLKVYKELNDYINVQIYPYGNVETTVHSNGTVEYECQHGPKECYGNKLHACAIDILGKNSYALIGCTMEKNNKGKGSDDLAADKCGRKLKIDVAPIKKCAKCNRGDELQKYYGEESDKINYNYVPYVLVNGVEWDQEEEPDFKQHLCEAFAVPPPPCI